MFFFLPSAGFRFDRILLTVLYSFFPLSLTLSSNNSLPSGKAAWRFITTILLTFVLRHSLLFMIRANEESLFEERQRQRERENIISCHMAIRLEWEMSVTREQAKAIERAEQNRIMSNEKKSDVSWAKMQNTESGNYRIQIGQLNFVDRFVKTERRLLVRFNWVSFVRFLSLNPLHLLIHEFFFFLFLFSFCFSSLSWGRRGRIIHKLKWKPKQKINKNCFPFCSKFK